MYEIKKGSFTDYECVLKYTINELPPTSEDCKLFAVTYALKNEIGSIRFSPKEMEEELSQQEIDKKLVICEPRYVDVKETGYMYFKKANTEQE